MAIKVQLHPRHAQLLQNHRDYIDANLTTFISWPRLVEALRKSGEFHSGEEIEAIELRDNGINIYLNLKKT